MPKRQGTPKRQSSLDPARHPAAYMGEPRLLTLERCRELLRADCHLSDIELENLRDSLYALAGLVLDTFDGR
jgi:hypothetical protein